MPGSVAVDPVERFYANIEQDALTGCWLWTGTVVTDAMRGYERAQFYDGRRLVSAHRWSYEYHIGAIPDGQQVYHRCGIGLCVNPQHLEAAPANRRCASKTACPADHEYSTTNTYVHPVSGARACRTCQRENVRRDATRPVPYWLRKSGRYRADVSTPAIIWQRALGVPLRQIALSVGMSQTGVRRRLRSVGAPASRG